MKKNLMCASADLGPHAQALLDFLYDHCDEGHCRVDHFDVRQSLGMTLSSALKAAKEIHAAGLPIEVNQGRITWFLYSPPDRARP